VTLEAGYRLRPRHGIDDGFLGGLDGGLDGKRSSW